MNDWKIDKTWTLFLDRDGVINERIFGGYIKTIDEFHFIEGTEKAIASFSKIFSNIFVITNQQGIAKNIMSERNLLDIHDYMTVELEKHQGKLTKCYYAPGLKNEPNSIRKPNIGMGLLAKKEFPEIVFEKSIMIGDTDSDIQFGKNLGMKTVRIKTDEPINIDADITCLSLIEFSKLISFSYEK
jgi:histidinol-phosphate phosphatase family protein